jgi:HK97 gp10 family phage protein
VIVGPIKGIAKLAASIDAKQKKISNAVATAITRGALKVQGRSKEKIMRGAKSGKVYYYGKGGKRVHRASFPGQSPANWTGNLARSIKAIKAEHSNGVWTAKVVANAPYAAALEFGTRSAGRSRRVAIEERPFMRPALAELKDEIDADIKRAVEEGMKS